MFPLQGRTRFAGGHDPDTDAVVVVARDEQAAVRGEGERLDAAANVLPSGDSCSDADCVKLPSGSGGRGDFACCPYTSAARNSPARAKVGSSTARKPGCVMVIPRYRGSHSGSPIAVSRPPR